MRPRAAFLYSARIRASPSTGAGEPEKEQPIPRPPLSRLTLAALLGMAALISCGTPPPDPPTLLPEAKKHLDDAQSLTFHIESKDAQPTSGVYIIGGDGVMKRPDGVAGTVHVLLSGILTDVQVVAVNGKFYVQVLFSPWTLARPTDYGFQSPSLLLDPDKGLSSLITQSHNPVVQDNDRYNGEELYEVKTKVPGDSVNNLLTSADPTVDDDATFGIDVNTHQLRKIVLYGPFFHKGQNSTYTVVLDNYGTNVSITPAA